MTDFIVIGLIAEFLAAITATIYFFKYKNSLMWLLLPLLWYIPLNEFICQFYFGSSRIGYLLLNIYDIIVGPTILIITMSQLRSLYRRRVVGIILLLYTCGYFINITLINPFEELSSIVPTISAVTVIIGLLYYLIELLKSDRIINIGKDLFLWIAMGFLIFSLAYPVIYFAQKYVVLDNISLLKSIYTIQYVVIIISYLTIAFGFFYGEKRESLKQRSN